MPSDARRRAEEALATYDRGGRPAPSYLATALRALLAEPQAPAPDGFDPTCPRCRRPLSDHHPDHNNDPVCADFPSAPAAPQREGPR